MGKSQKKRLLAASERFRRNYIHYFLGQHVNKFGETYVYMHIEPRRVWK